MKLKRRFLVWTVNYEHDTSHFEPIPTSEDPPPKTAESEKLFFRVKVRTAEPGIWVASVELFSDVIYRSEQPSRMQARDACEKAVARDITLRGVRDVMGCYGLRVIK